MNHVPVSYLRECFDLDAERGILTWKVRPRHHFPDARSHSSTNSRLAGRPAGKKLSTGYLSVSVAFDGEEVRLQVHRVIWALHTGKWPTAFIDHINRDKAHNPVANLREATKSQNTANTGPARRNKIGLKGVSAWRGRFRAQIRSDGRVIYLGMFDTPQLAHAAYCAAAIEHHGEFAGGLTEVSA